MIKRNMNRYDGDTTNAANKNPNAHKQNMPTVKNLTTNDRYGNP